MMDYWTTWWFTIFTVSHQVCFINEICWFSVCFLKQSWSTTGPCFTGDFLIFYQCWDDHGSSDVEHGYSLQQLWILWKHLGFAARRTASQSWHQSLSPHLRRNFHNSWEIDGCAQQTATGQFLPCMAGAGCGSRVYESLRAKLWSQDRGPPVGFDGTFRGRRWKTWLRYAAPKASQHWNYSATAQSKFAKGSCCKFCFGHSTRARWKAEEWKM